jgi:hypothetical protein
MLPEGMPTTLKVVAGQEDEIVYDEIQWLSQRVQLCRPVSLRRL